jgi:hypothetical protein
MTFSCLLFAAVRFGDTHVRLYLIFVLPVINLSSISKRKIWRQRDKLAGAFRLTLEV